MAKVLGELLLGVLSSAIYEGGKAGLARFFAQSPARKAIDATAKDFPGIPGVGDALAKWCQSDQFAERLSALNRGDSPEVRAALVDSLVEAGGFYDGLTKTHESARRVLEVFWGHLERELHISGEGTLIAARRAEARHGETKADLERISAQLDERAEEIKAVLRDELDNQLPVPTRLHVLQALDRMNEDTWEGEAAHLRDLVSVQQLGTEPSQSAGLYTSAAGASIPDVTSLNASMLPRSQAPPPSGEFVGRQATLDEVAGIAKTARMVLFTGIPGVGKTALMRHLAAGFEPGSVFWYSFDPGLISISDILLRLAVLLDEQAGPYTNLAEVILTATLPLRAQIDLIIQELNKRGCHLFFEKVHLAAADSAVSGFLTLLKERLEKGTVYLESRSVPPFYHAHR